MRFSWVLEPMTLAFMLPFLVDSQDPNECTIPYDTYFNAFPPCARYCLACQDENWTFGHNCYYPSGQCCLDRQVGDLIQSVWACVDNRCGDEVMQVVVDLWMEDCANDGITVADSLLPNIEVQGKSVSKHLRRLPTDFYRGDLQLQRAPSDKEDHAPKQLLRQ